MSKDYAKVHAAVLAGLAAAGARKHLAATAQPKDERPRFRDGRLKDLRAHLEETLDWELIHATDDPRSAPYIAQHKAEIDLYLSRFGAAQQAEAAEAQHQDELRAMAREAGADEERYATDPEYRKACAARVAAALQRVPLKEKAEALNAALGAPLPEIVDPAAVAG